MTRLAKHVSEQSAGCFQALEESKHYAERCIEAIMTLNKNIAPQFRMHWLFMLLALFRPAFMVGQSSSAGTDTPDSYSLSVAVDEVSLTFHASDVHGLPINDLKREELKLLDNRKEQKKIVAFEPFLNISIRAGILIDTSPSMDDSLAKNQATSIQYVQRILRQQTDQAFVMDFDFLSNISQPWTSDPVALNKGIVKAFSDGRSRLGGTAIIDTLYRACRNQFRESAKSVSGNFILLFSDGQDNRSRGSLKETVDACQRTNTAIYVFRPSEQPSFSSGFKLLAQLAGQTGGMVFHADDSDDTIYSNLRIIEQNMRNQYRLIYKPTALKHDGSFHHIELEASDRVKSIAIRSGYYAPSSRPTYE